MTIIINVKHTCNNITIGFFNKSKNGQKSMKKSYMTNKLRQLYVNYMYMHMRVVKHKTFVPDDLSCLLAGTNRYN